MIGRDYRALVYKRKCRSVIEIKKAHVGGVTLAGVGIITPDITSDQYVINEANMTPGLENHYFIDNQGCNTRPIQCILMDHFALGEKR